MSFKIHFLFSFSFLFYIADAFNISNILSNYSDFSTFNSYLTQTSLAGDINSRQTITVLVVSNGNISPLSGKPSNVLKSIMSVHVILDYYDLKRLQDIQNKSMLLTTLFQASGIARGQQGFLNVSNSGSEVNIASAVPGSPVGASVVGSVISQPYNVSVLQISNVIVPEGLDNVTYSSPPPSPSPKPAKSPTPARSPSPAKSHKSPPAPAPAPVPSPSPSNASSPTADAPAADDTPSSGISLSLSLESVLIIISSALSLVMV